MPARDRGAAVRRSERRRRARARLASAGDRAGVRAPALRRRGRQWPRHAGRGRLRHRQIAPARVPRPPRARQRLRREQSGDQQGNAAVRRREGVPQRARLRAAAGSRWRGAARDRREAARGP